MGSSTNRVLPIVFMAFSKGLFQNYLPKCVQDDAGVTHPAKGELFTSSHVVLRT